MDEMMERLKEMMVSELEFLLAMKERLRVHSLESMELLLEFWLEILSVEMTAS